MTTHTRLRHRLLLGAILLACCALASPALAASSGVVGAAYHPDTPFPQFMYLWQEGWSLKDADGNKLIYARPDMPLGGYVFVYYRNTGNDAIKITDLTIEGVKLSAGIGVTETPERTEDKFGASILLSELPKDRIDLLKAAGTPVWWKAEPEELPAGAIGEIVIRLRRDPEIEKLNIGIVTNKGVIPAVVPVNHAQPRFTTISFMPELDAVYLYARHPKRPGMKPEKIFLDGRDVTAMSSIASDESLEVAPVMIRLSEPLKWMSYHNLSLIHI